MIANFYRDLLDADPPLEVQNYILIIGIRNNSTRSELMSDF